MNTRKGNWNHLTRWVGVLAFAAAPVAVAQAEEQQEVAKAVRMQLPQAAALTESVEGKGPIADFRNQSLTVVFLAGIDFVKPNDPNFKPLMKEVLRAGELLHILSCNGKSKYTSTLNEEFIKGVTCNVRGDEAKGVITFQTPRLWEGKVEYAARKTSEGWRVEEFQLPTVGWTTKRGADGNWVATKK